eukprot:UN06618
MVMVTVLSVSVPIGMILPQEPPGQTVQQLRKHPSFGHLRAAGLIPGGSGTDPTRPTNAYGGLIGIQNGSLAMAGP